MRTGKILINYYLCQGGYVFISVCLFVVSKQDYTKSTQRIFTKFGGKVVRGPKKNQCSNPDPGVFLKNAYHCSISNGNGKGSLVWVEQHSRIMQISN